MLADHGPRARFAGVSRFSHPTFRARVADPSRHDGDDEYKRTVCIVCQRWFCDIKNPDPKSRFYDTFQKPECYFLWLGDRADTSQAQAEYRAMPYSVKKGDGGLTNGWRQKDAAACTWCKKEAASAPAREKHEQAIALSNKRPTSKRVKCVNHATCGGYVGKKGHFCVKCQAASS
jgi:hypothetical protein